MASSSRGYGGNPPSTPVPQQILPNDGAYRPEGRRRNQYFVPGEGIIREVIQADICKYLDNDATVRPGKYEGRQGFMLYAYRNLTSAMLEDIRRDSASYEREMARSGRRHGNSRPTGNEDAVQQYERSRTYHDRHSDQPEPTPGSHDYSGRMPPADPRGGGASHQPYITDAPSYTAQTSGQPYGMNPNPQGYAPGYDRTQQYPNDPRSPPMYEYNQAYQMGNAPQPNYGYAPPGQTNPQARQGYPQALPDQRPQYEYADPRMMPQQGLRQDPGIDPRQYADPRAGTRPPEQRYGRR